MQLATPDELNGYLETTVPQTRAELMLDLASEAVLAAVAVPLDGVASTTVRLHGDGTKVLLLPTWPVSNVTAVTVDDEDPLDPDRYRWERSGIIHRRGAYWSDGAEIEVTYDHGFAEPPAGLRGVCLMVAARAVANPARFQGFQGDGVNATYGSAAGSAGLELTLGEAELVRRALG